MSAKDYRILTGQTTDSRVVSVVCPRCSETVELNPHPLYNAGFEDWGHAVSDLLERFHCPEPIVIRRWWQLFHVKHRESRICRSIQ